MQTTRSLVAIAALIVTSASAVADPAVGSMNLSLHIPATNNLVSSEQDSFCLDDRNGEFSFQLQHTDRADASGWLLADGRCGGAAQKVALSAEATGGVYYLLVAPE